MSRSSSNVGPARGRARVFFSLGSNLGSREQNILGAVNRFQRERGIEIKELSSLYETEPLGEGFSRTFINAVCIAESIVEPRELLRRCRVIEREFGRGEDGCGRDRTLDVDIIVYGGLVLDEPELKLPHPRFRERLFVLEPFSEIAPDQLIPPDGVSIKEILGRFDRNAWVRQISSRKRIY